jgi:hypothetical protein
MLRDVSDEVIALGDPMGTGLVDSLAPTRGKWCPSFRPTVLSC